MTLFGHDRPFKLNTSSCQLRWDGIVIEIADEVGREWAILQQRLSNKLANILSWVG